MTRRNLFSELTEGFGALAAKREDKVTLNQHTVEINPAPLITASELTGIHQSNLLPAAHHQNDPLGPPESDQR